MWKQMILNVFMQVRNTALDCLPGHGWRPGLFKTLQKFILAFCGLMVFPFVVHANQVIVNAGQPGTPNLVKKFHMMQTGYTPAWLYQQLNGRLRDIDCASIRIDHIWDLHNIVSGIYPNFVYDWTQLDAKIEAILADDCTPYFCLSYTPDVLGGQYNPPNNYQAWQEINRQLALHCVARGYGIRYYEVWNEPDLDIFWTGTQQQYLDLYEYTVNGVLQGDPNALVGGPGFSGSMNNVNWVNALLDFCVARSLPVDFVSFHNFTPDVNITIWVMQQLQDMIDAHPSLGPVELHLGEWNNELVSGNGYWGDRAEGATWLLGAMKSLLPYENLTIVQRAQYIDIGGGLAIGNLGALEPNGSHIKAIYNAYKLYAMTPEERVAVNTYGVIQAMAAANADTIGVLMWNNSDNTLNIDLQIDQISLPYAKIERFLIDREHSSYLDNPASEELQLVETSTRTLSGSFTQTITFEPFASCLVRLLRIPQMPVTLTYGIKAGWNLLSVPVMADNMNVAALFPAIAEYAYIYKDQYVQVTEVHPGQGFWLYSSGNNLLQITGYPVNVEPIDLIAGWNLIGTGQISRIPWSAFAFSPKEMLAVPFVWDPSSSAYTIPDTFDPALGFWLFCTTSGSLNFYPTLDKALPVQGTNGLVGLVPPPPPDHLISHVQQSDGPEQFVLSANYPNPFNGMTTVTFTLPEPLPVTIEIFDIRGRCLSKTDKSVLNAGSHSVVWDGLDQQGNPLPSGTYFCSLKAGSFDGRLKMVLLR
ncbi:T9SS type A sorting domain-containing protein [candidate division KSB1 bacterium]|nr:T9SS type A sorting domain-containing protein [candidate division KSB1 bacterium]